MRTVTRQEIESWHGSDPYYAGRIPYLLAATEIITKLPGESALEIGPYRHTIIPGCDTMDMDRRLPGITYYHDATNTPWPVPVNKRYDLIVGLQVWEHMGFHQPTASCKAFHFAKHVLLSFPYLWPKGGTPGHDGIDRDRIAEWTCFRDPILTLRVASDAPGLSRRIDRIIYLFEGDA